jgi:hypothetical protein
MGKCGTEGAISNSSKVVLALKYSVRYNASSPSQPHVIVGFANKIRNWRLPIPKSIVESDVVVGWPDSDAERGSTFIFSRPYNQILRNLIAIQDLGALNQLIPTNGA